MNNIFGEVSLKMQNLKLPTKSMENLVVRQTL